MPHVSPVGQVLYCAFVFGALSAPGVAQGNSPVMLTGFEQAYSIGPFVAFDGSAYFGVTVGFGDAQFTALYRSEGTPEGTIPIWQANGMHNCSPLAHGRSLLYFAAYHPSGVAGDIWCTDGTAAGCRYIGTFYSNYDWGPEQGTVGTLGDSLYFRAPQDNSSCTPASLWRTDGTPESTCVLHTFEEAAWILSPSLILPIPRGLTPLDDKMMFAAYDSDHGDELWITDGTPEGTRLLADLYPGPYPPPEMYSSLPRWFQSAGSYIYFQAGECTANTGYAQCFGQSQVWRTDGTPEGTERIAGPAFETLGLTILQDWIIASNTREPDPYCSLWRVPLHGTQAELLRQFDVSGFGYPGNIVRMGNQLYFSARGDGLGVELWRTDGTPEGTALVADIYPGADSALIDYLFLPGNEIIQTDGEYLLFHAADGVHGYEPWISDGTSAGTRMLADLRPGSYSSMPSYTRWPVAAINGKFYVAADDGVHGKQVWAMTPATGSDLPADPCVHGGLYETGDSIRLCVPEENAWAIQWYHNGVPLPGEVYPSLCLFNLQPEHSGHYTATYDDGTKTPTQYDVYITVADEVPAANPTTVAFLFAVAGVFALFRFSFRRLVGFWP